MATGVKVHPAAALVPEPTEQEFADLKADIKAHGLRERIVMLDGAILDGRSRHRALRELVLIGSQDDGLPAYARGATPAEAADPIAFVVSMNLRRRHLTRDARDRVMVAVLAQEEKSAEERQRATRFGAQADGERQSDADRGKAAAKVAKQFGVSTRTVERAKHRHLETLGERDAKREARSAAARKAASTREGNEAVKALLHPNGFNGESYETRLVFGRYEYLGISEGDAGRWEVYQAIGDFLDNIEGRSFDSVQLGLPDGDEAAADLSEGVRRLKKAQATLEGRLEKAYAEAKARIKAESERKMEPVRADLGPRVRRSTRRTARRGRGNGRGKSTALDSGAWLRPGPPIFPMYTLSEGNRTSVQYL